MTKRLLFGAIILCLVALGALWAWERLAIQYEESSGPVRVSPAKTTVPGDPDDFVTVVFTLRNLGDREHSYELSTEAPPGWTVLDELHSVTVGSQAQHEVFLTAQIPPMTPPGQYWLAVRAQSDSLSAIGRTRINVRARERLKLFLAESDLILRPGEEKTLALTVINRGNVSARVSVAVTAAPVGWQFQLRERSIALAPGQSQTVELTVRPLQDVAIAPAPFTVQASSASSRDELSFTVVLSPR